MRSCKIVAVALALTALGGAAQAQSLETLYAQARQEGRVVLYGGGSASIYQGAADRFERKYPGIKVEIRAAGSNTLAEEIDAQRKSGGPRADIAVLQTIQDFVRWKNEGALAAFKPDGFDNIPEAFKDADGAFVGVQIFALTYAHNPALIPASEMAKSPMDFLDARYAGRIISTYPTNDDVTLYLYDNIVRKHGWDFMSGLMKNRPTFVTGHMGVSQKIGAGEFAATFDNVLSFGLLVKARGGKVENVIPETEEMPVWPQTAGLLRNSPHPAAAKLFLAFYLSAEEQAIVTRSGTWSARTDISPPEGLRPLERYKVANGFRSFMADESRIGQLRKRFEEFIGPVKAGEFR